MAAVQLLIYMPKGAENYIGPTCPRVQGGLRRITRVCVTRLCVMQRQRIAFLHDVIHSVLTNLYHQRASRLSGVADPREGVTGRQVPIFSYFSDLFLFIPIFPEKLLFFLFFQKS